MLNFWGNSIKLEMKSYLLSGNLMSCIFRLDSDIVILSRTNYCEDWEIFKRKNNVLMLPYVLWADLRSTCVRLVLVFWVNVLFMVPVCNGCLALRIKILCAMVFTIFKIVNVCYTDNLELWSLVTVQTLRNWRYKTSCRVPPTRTKSGGKVVPVSTELGIAITISYSNECYIIT